MKHYFFKFQYFIILFFFYSCSNDYEDNILEINSKSKFDVKYMKYSDLVKNQIAYKKVERFFKKNTFENESQRLMDLGYSFSIDTDKFLYIGNNEEHSYTFNIYRLEEKASSDEDYTENLVLKKNEKCTIRSLFISICSNRRG